MRGVNSGANIVETKVNVMDSAKLAFAKYVTTFDAVPPGHDPTIMSPMNNSGGKFSALPIQNAIIGIKTY